MLNDVFFKEVACRDVDYAKKYNPQVFKKIQTIIRYIEEKAPPYFGYCKAEFFSKTSTLFPGC
jgi:Txe/YoeB family toxin of Txe-Axe toxin-antitoxin module